MKLKRFDFFLEKYSKHKGREPFKTGDKIKFDPESQWASDQIYTVIEDEGPENYDCVWAHPMDDSLAGDRVIYQGEKWEVGFKEDLPEGKIVIEHPQSGEEKIVDSSSIEGKCYKDYIWVLVEPA